MKDTAPKSDAWNIYDPGAHYRDLCARAIEKHSGRLHPEEKTATGLIKMLVKHIDTAITAVRPEPVVVGGVEGKGTNVAPQPIPVK